MKRKEFSHPIMLAKLISRGVGRRKARRMIKHAVFVGHKTGTRFAFWDDSNIAGFCIWADQGKYMHSWLEANNAG